MTSNTQGPRPPARSRAASTAAAILCLGLAAAAGWTGGGGEARAQSAFVSAERDFSIQFPAAPAVDSRPPAHTDDSSYRTYVAERDGGLYAVRVDQYPLHIPVPSPSERVYDLLLRAHGVETESRLLSVERTQLGGLPTLQGVYRLKSGATERTRVLMVGRRVYQVSYTSPTAASAPAAGDAFLDSFRITPPVAR